MEHELKELPDNYRCDQCGMFFSSAEGHHYFKLMEIEEARVKVLRQALQNIQTFIRDHAGSSWDGVRSFCKQALADTEDAE